MPSLKIVYFDLTGRAEPVRLALAIGEIPFEDERIQFSDWPGMKASTPYGSLPLLQVDDQVFAESSAMLRYAGKEAGLYPTDHVEALKVDQYVDYVGSIADAIVAGFQQKFVGTDPTVPSKKAEKTAKTRVFRPLRHRNYGKNGSCGPAVP